jgi:branched-chain amino acid transport system ATP-binding protein
MSGGALLQARGIRTGYGRLPVVFDIDLEVHEGEIVALLGANGAGKTTTLRALSGMLPLLGGDITLDGRSLKGRPPEKIAREGVVHVPQGRGIFPNLRVEETLRLAGALAGAKGTVDSMYDVFPRLHERRMQLAGTLSGGEQQMLAIARGLIMRPRVLLIDEMSQGLAPAIVDGLFELVRSLPEQGVSVLIVEQFVTHALDVASRAYVLEKGEVAYAGSAAELAKDEEFVRGSYLGDATADPDDLADLRSEETPDELLRAIEKRAAEEGRDPGEVVMGLLREAMTANGKGGHS